MNRMTNCYVCCFLTCLVVCLLIGCSSNENNPIQHYVRNSIQGEVKVLSAEGHASNTEDWKLFALGGDKSILCPANAEQVDPGRFLIRNHDGYSITLDARGGFTDTPFSVYLDGVDDVEQDLFQVVHIDARETDSSQVDEVRAAVKSLQSISDLELLRKLFEHLDVKSSSGSSNLAEAFVISISNYQTIELGEKLWRYTKGEVNCYAGISLSNSDSERRYIYAWVLEKSGQSQLFLTFAVNNADFELEAFQLLLTTLVDGVQLKNDGEQ